MPGGAERRVDATRSSVGAKYARQVLQRIDYAKYATLDGCAEDVVEVCVELDLSDFVFVGQSVNAMIGVLAALPCP